MPAVSPHVRSHGLRSALTVLATFGTAAVGFASPVLAQSAHADTLPVASTAASTTAASTTDASAPAVPVAVPAPAVATSVHASAAVAAYHGSTTVAITVREGNTPIEHAAIEVIRRTSVGPRYVTTLSTGTTGVAHIKVWPIAADSFVFSYRGGDGTAPSSLGFIAEQRSFGSTLLAAAARKIGAPYQWGASGPTRFDCSGFTSYIAREFGRSLPHTAAGQYASVHHVSRSSMQIGDLVFFYSGGGIYHVGFYAGHGRILAATHTGDFVREESIYTSDYLVGRLAP